MSLLLALAAASAAAATPAPAPAVTGEAARLAQIVAENGMLATIAPMIAANEAREIAAEHPEWTAADQATFQATASEVATTMRGQIVAAEAAAFAAHLSLDDLRTIAAYSQSPAAANQRAAMPAIMAQTAQVLDKLDHKGTLKAAFCARTGKLCEK